MTENKIQYPAIAVVGVGALFPGSTDAAGFWQDILAGTDHMRDVPESHWLIEDYYDPDPAAPDKTYCKRGAFIDPVAYDCMGFGTPPSLVQATDTCQLLALIVAKQVLDDATDGQFEQMDKDRVSVILGATGATELVVHLGSRLQRPLWLKALRECGVPESEAQQICQQIADQYVPWTEASFPGLLGNVVAGRIANRFDLGGTNCVVDAACASSQSALSMALNELYLHQSDLCITGGVDTLNDILMYMCFSKTPALSATGDCRPFSDQADGTMMGEGLGMLALKRLDDAERDGDQIYAVIRGMGSSSDGKAKSVYAPSSSGQARALRRSYQNAGYGPETVELVEAHGTGTTAGDAAEFGGLSLVFGETQRNDTQWCALGSIKSQIGHTKGAAGAASLFKAVMALHHKILPPTIKVERPNPKLDIEQSPFYLNTRSRPWIRDAAHPRRASVSSFGFGGSNFHVTLEEYLGESTAARRFRPTPTQLITLSADRPESLATRCRELTHGFQTQDSLSFLARTTQEAYDATQPARLAIVASDLDDLRKKLTDAAAAISSNPGREHNSPVGWYYANASSPGKIAFLFPGQGSQYLGMGTDLALAFDVARKVWDRAANAQFDPEYRLHDVVFPRPVFEDSDLDEQTRRLTATEWAQPALGAASLAQLAVLRQLGLHPDCVGGHSFGEVTALCAANALDETGLLGVARKRGELMAETAASTSGSMTAVAHPADQLASLLPADVVIANHNSPNQAVLSGPTSSIEQVEAMLGKRGISCRRLPVATAFHSPLVSGASQPFADFLRGIAVRTPAIPVYANSSAAPYDEASDAIRQKLAGQLAQPVRFVEQIRAMYAAGIRTFVEVGPSSVLSNLVGDILGEQPHLAVNLDRKGQHGLTALWHGLARLIAHGSPLELGALWGNVRPIDDPRTRVAPKLAIELSGVNHDKPYPPEGGAAGLPQPNPPRQEPVPMTTPTSTLPPAQPAAAESLQWIEAFQDLQRQTADAHLQFLRVAEQSLAGLQSLIGGDPMPTMPAAPFSAPLQTAPTPMQATATPMQSTPAPVATAPSPTPTSVASAMPTAAPTPSPATTAQAPAAPATSPVIDLAGLMLAVVAEKTGYPEEMLGLEMELESELGIDSIKRVEILSAMQERAPGLPDVDPAELGSLRTLGEIVDYMARNAPAATAATAPAAAATAPSATPPIDLAGLMLAVVAEKTGYPEEMLGLEMELESELGIDSIKRVEILSAMQERAPGLPDVDPAELGSLRTLGEIVDYMARNAPAATAATAPAAAATAPSAAPPIDLAGLMLAVVAEKTGYPEDMLGLEMELESELGIDSIKRVEILSAMQERAPGLPDVDPAELGSLRTLGEIVDYMARNATDSPATAQQPAAGEPAPLQVERFDVLPVQTPAPGFVLPHLLDGQTVTITDEGTGVADALANRLRALGVPAEVSSEVPPDTHVVISLDGLRPVESEQQAMATSRHVFSIATTLASRFERESRTLVLLQDTGGDFGFGGRQADRAYLGGLSGLAKTAALEWPESTVRVIDLERGDRSAEVLAETLVEELLTGGDEIEIGLPASGGRLKLRSQQAPAPEGTPVVTRESVLVVSGGARGVTAASLIELARRSWPQIALLGRTRLKKEPACCHGVTGDAELKKVLLLDAQSRGEKLTPAELGQMTSRIQSRREICDTLDQLGEAGAEARYFSCDIGDSAAVEQTLAEVRKNLGPITGIVHGAGVLADKMLSQKTEEQFDWVFGTKVAGLRNLLNATHDDPLSLICLFSSVAARTGNPGQSDYAMANEVLNRVAHREAQQRSGCLVKSINWGPWQSGMVTPALEQKFKALGVPLIQLDEGARRFVDELQTTSSSQVEVVIGGLLAPPRNPRRFEVTVGASTHPYLESHQVQGVVVLPLVLAQEWLLRAARAACPERVVSGCSKLRVLRGIQLERFSEQSERFTIQVDSDDEGSLSLTLLDMDGMPRYSCNASLADHRPTPSQPPVLDLPAVALPGHELYGDKLFHGPAFAALREVDRLGAEGAQAELIGSALLDWPEGSWLSDPALLDGGLQLARVWGFELLGRPTLPTSLGELISYGEGLSQGPIRCLLTGHSIGKSGTRTDLWFVDRDGRLQVEIRGLEMHVTQEAVSLTS